MPSFRSGSGRGAHWQDALDEALAGWGRLATGDIGLLYVDERHAGDVDLIVHELVRRTTIESWFGTISKGIFGSCGPRLDECDLALLAPPWNRQQIRIVGGGHGREDLGFDGGSDRPFALVHGDRRLRRALPMPDVFGNALACGGITAARGAPMQVLHRPAEDELGALILDPALKVVAGISQSCVPIGPHHVIDAANGAWLRRLDGRPAYAVLGAEVGEILSRQPERISGYIHVEITSEGDERGFVRPILALEPRSGEIATAEPLRRGQKIRFVKRDADAARTSFAALIEDLRSRLEGAPAAGLYIASRQRITSLFAAPTSELEHIEKTFGPIPMAGFCTEGEIFASRLHDWSSVLVLFE